MESEGKLLGCDRCGAEVFLKLKGQKEMDGGYTRYNTFEDPPAGWFHSSDLGKRLCPDCAKEYKNLIFDFYCQKSKEVHR